MQLQYSLLFKVRFLHDYFPADSHPPIDVIPTPDTARLMQRLGIRLVNRNEGVELFYSNEPSAQEALMAVVSDQLSFILRTTDPFFLNYTDVPVNLGQETIYHLTNLASQSGTFQVKGSETIPVSTAGNHPGSLALLTIYLGDNETGTTPLVSNGMVIPVEYSFAFTARNTIWRYYLIDQGNMGYGEFQLLDHASRQPLAPPADTPVTVPLPDGSKAVVLTSGSAIPLRQRPGQRFQLRMTSTSSGRSAAIDLNLPSADAARISRDESPPPDASEAPIFYSDVYVYL